jgi:signal transduction histidine kinase
MPQSQPTFTVDTQLFRELGELLVGRDSIALAELVKNSYDADATSVRVIGQRLEDGGAGSITVVDDGIGMSRREFETGYLTIAGRGKEAGDRRSLRFGRRFTGEKGIGRLATHKLARRLDIQSIAAAKQRDEAVSGRSKVRAKIDWDAIERYETLAEIGGDALRVEPSALRQAQPTGTAIVLSGLRHAWDEEELQKFIVEMTDFEPPQLLLNGLPKEFLAARPALEALPYRDATSKQVFSLELDGDFALAYGAWDEVAKTTDWVIELDSTPRRVVIRIAPTHKTTGRFADAEPVTVRFPPEDGKVQPSFTARIFARENYRGTRRKGEFITKVAGIRVYMEGFRVPPYGEAGNDWLELNRDYARRNPKLDLDVPGLPAATADREGLKGLPNNAYVGAVLLTHAGADKLKMLVNREGFVPTPEVEAIRQTVRTAVNLLTRVRAGYGVAEGSAKRSDGADGTVPYFSAEVRLRDEMSDATRKARDLRRIIADLGASALGEDVDQLVESLESLEGLAEQAATDRSLLRILASVGTQMAAFIHETEGLAGSASSIARALDRLADEDETNEAKLRRLADRARDVGDRINAQARYLTDTTTVSKRERRRRLKVSERLDSAIGLLLPVADRQEIAIENKVPVDLRTTPMFAAELTVLYGNLLTNAVKAAGKGGRIRCRGERNDKGLKLRVENTGARVDPAEGEQWFLPFASTTADSIDPALGQGMGLGLPITRSIVEDYRGTIRFTKPRKGFKTALEVRLP